MIPTASDWCSSRSPTTIRCGVGSTDVFARLLAQPGVVEDVALGLRVGVMAFHGGSLEAGTDDIAREVAEITGASLYVVALPPDLLWHVPSHLVSPESSAKLGAFLDHVETVLAVHGYGREGLWDSVLLGGRNRLLATHVRERLTEALPDVDTITDLERIPAALRGLHPDNPVNRPPGGGVQIELPPRVRGRGPRADAGDVARLVEGLAEAIATLPDPGLAATG